MADKVEKLAKVGALVEFRKKHFKKEMEENLTVLKTIRDNEKSSAREKTDACNAIARHLGGLQPDSTKLQNKGKDESPFSKEQDKSIMDRVNKVLGGK